jgi:hypothetical protein
MSVRLTQPGDAHGLSYVVDHGKGLLIVSEIKRDRGLACQSIARGRHLLNQRAPQRGERSLGGPFELMKPEGQVEGLRVHARWLAARRVDLR